jgi:membrane peptidoglycan carboxypeptidase
MSVPLDDGRVPATRVLSHLGVMVLVSAVMGVVVAGLAIPFAGIAGITARNMADSMSELPANLETRALPQRTRILAADGSTIATLYDENRVNVSLSNVAKVMRQAILAIEDYRFYEHGALDVKGTVRALVTNQAAGGVVQGGSSITQQMVKLTLLSQAKTKKERIAAQEETFSRKIRELRYAIAFEQNHSKDWILERYLNIAYFGDGVYGVQAAARHYFSTDAKKLNLRQAATLAGLVKNPVGYDPTVYPDRALSRRNVVLERMAELNVISIDRAEREASKRLGLKLTPNRNGCMFSRAPFFCDYVVNFLKRDPALGANPKERQEVLLSGGLTIKTTIDLRFQDAADNSVQQHVYKNDQAIGGLAFIEPRSGNVRALAQSLPMGRDKKDGETFLNYTVPKEYGHARGFQPGSTFKAFVLAAAIKQNIPLTTTINAPPQITLHEADYEDCDGAPYGYGLWPVHNSTTSGPKNLYTGTRESVNTFFAQLEQRTGLCEPFKLARQMGIHLTNPRLERVPSFTLGVGDASPLEMAEAYATFAGRGLHCDSRPVTAILDSNKTVVKDYPKSCTQVLPSAVADAVNDVLRGVQEPGGFGYGTGINLRQVSAGKTGTTTGQKAVWFVGYTPNLVGASMIAGANTEGQPISLQGQAVGGTYVNEATGSGTAGPMWAGAMDVIEQWLDDVDFVRPSGEDIAGLLVSIPDVGGMSVEKATDILESLGFVVATGGMKDSAYPRGTVAYTSPGAGGQLSSADTIVLYISDGTPYVKPKKHKPKPTETPTIEPDPNPGNGDPPGQGNGGIIPPIGF